MLVLEKHLTAFGFVGLCKTSRSVGVDIEENSSRWSVSTPKPKATFYEEFSPFLFSHMLPGVAWNSGGGGREDSELQANLDYIVRIETLRSI